MASRVTLIHPGHDYENVRYSLRVTKMIAQEAEKVLIEWDANGPRLMQIYNKGNIGKGNESIYKSEECLELEFPQTEDEFSKVMTSQCCRMHQEPEELQIHHRSYRHLSTLAL